MDLLFGCLLEWGLPLSLPYESREIQGCKVHFYNGGDLAACFSKNITDEVIREIAGKRPSKAVFCDNCFSGSPDKTPANSQTANPNPNGPLLRWTQALLTSTGYSRKQGKKHFPHCLYLLVQAPEVCGKKTEAAKCGYKNICEIGRERIKRAGEKIKKDTNAKILWSEPVFQGLLAHGPFGSPSALVKLAVKSSFPTPAFFKHTLSFAYTRICSATMPIIFVLSLGWLCLLLQWMCPSKFCLPKTSLQIIFRFSTSLSSMLIKITPSSDSNLRASNNLENIMEHHFEWNRPSESTFILQCSLPSPADPAFAS